MGTVPYAMALDLQLQIVNQVQKNPEQIYLLGLEHPPVITLGKRGHAEADIKVEAEVLENLGIQTYKIDRGGQATLHSPGQLVIYPIVNLNYYGLSVKDFSCLLIKSTQDFFNHFELEITTKENSPGVYTQKGKIAFFGFRVKQNVTYHGLSINIHNDLKLFDYIKSCGVENLKIDKLANYNEEIDPKNLFKVWERCFIVRWIEQLEFAQS